MRQLATIFLHIVLLIDVLLISGQMSARAQSNDDQTLKPKQEKLASKPDLSDIIPKLAKLSGDLATLKNRVTGLLDIS